VNPNRIPTDLARRIDRLSRAAHGFHRYAHHPLCAAYAPEVIRLGRTRICRGCALAAAGLLLGLGAGVLLPSAGLPLLAAAAGLAALAGLPGMAGRRWHPGKSLTRFLPVGLAAFLLIQCFRPPDPARMVLAGLVILGFCLGVLFYRRRGPDRSTCEACPELPTRPSCSGFAPIRRRERAFQRLAALWIEKENEGRMPTG
jgi:hypothetical protein